MARALSLTDVHPKPWGELRLTALGTAPTPTSVPLQQSVTQVLRHTGTDLVQQSTSKLSSFTQLQRVGQTLANEDPSGGTVQLTSRWEGPVWCVTSVPTAGGGGTGQQAPTYIRRWLDDQGAMVFEMATPAPGAGGSSNGLVTAVRRFTRVGGPLPLVAEPRSREAVPPRTPRGSGEPGAAHTSSSGSKAHQQAAPAQSRRGQAAPLASAPAVVATPDDLQLRVNGAHAPGAATQAAAFDVFGDEDDLAELDPAPRAPPPPPPPPLPPPPPPVVVPTSSAPRLQPALHGEAVDEQTFENQRGVPGVGFSTAFLMAADPPAWSTADGRRCVAATPGGGGGSSGEGMYSTSNRRDSDTQLLPVGWTWHGPWRVGDTGQPVDPDGWCYAQSFGAMAGGGAAAQDGPGLLVRRRRWVRTRVRQEHPVPAQQQRQQAPPMSPVIESPQQPQHGGRGSHRQSPNDIAAGHAHPVPSTPPPTPPVPDVRPDAVLRHGGRAASSAHDQDTSFDSEISTTEADLHGRGAHAEWLRRSAAAAAVEQVGKPRDGAGGQAGAPAEKTPWRLAEEEIAAALAATRARRAGSTSARGASSRASSRTGGLGDDAESVMTDGDLDVRSRAASLSAQQQPLRRAARERLRRGTGSGASSMVSDLDALVPGAVEAHDLAPTPRVGGTASSNTDSVPATPVDPQHTIFARAGTLNETLRRAAVTTGAYTALHAGDTSDVPTDATIGSARRRDRLAAHSRPAAPALAAARQGKSHRGTLGRSGSSTSSLDGAAGRHGGVPGHSRGAAAPDGVSVKLIDESWVAKMDVAVLALQASVSAAAYSVLLAAWTGTTRLVTRHTRAVVAVLVAHALLMLVV